MPRHLYCGPARRRLKEVAWAIGLGCIVRLRLDLISRNPLSVVVVVVAAAADGPGLARPGGGRALSVAAVSLPRCTA